MECNICNKKYSSNFSLKRHFSTQHQNKNSNVNQNKNPTPEGSKEINIIPICNIMDQLILPEKEQGKWRHPFTCIISGPTKAGKTEWVKKFIKNISHMVWPESWRITRTFHWFDSLPNIFWKGREASGLPLSAVLNGWSARMIVMIRPAPFYRTIVPICI